MSPEPDISEQITLLRIDVGKVMTKLDILQALDTKVDAVGTVAYRADQSASSAHKRVDDMQLAQKWMLGIFLTGLGVMIGALGLLWNIMRTV